MDAIPLTPDRAAQPKHLARSKGSGNMLRSDLIHVSRSLHAEYDQHLGSELVASEIDLAAMKFADAPVRQFVPLLVRRHATEALKAACRNTPVLNPGAVESR